MDGPNTTGQPRLIRDFQTNRHSDALLAKAFEQIALKKPQQDTRPTTVSSSLVIPNQACLTEKCQ